MTSFKLLRQLFVPFLGSALLFGLLSAFGVFYFLYFFGAFGIDQGVSYSGHSHLERSIYFGAVTGFWYWSAVKYLNPFLLKPSPVHWIVWYVFLMFLGGQFTFLLFNYFWNGQEFNWDAWKQISLEYPLMLVVPWFFYFSLELVGRKPAMEVDHASSRIHLKSTNGKDQLIIGTSDFLFASASENYLTIGYKKEGGVHTHVIRKTLKELEVELQENTSIARCHRSHLVHGKNSSVIRQSSGKITIQFGSHLIPISKTYQGVFTR